METIEINGQQYEVTGRAADGLPIVQGHATTTNHTDDAGNQVFDGEGNPKVSVHISVSPQAQPITPEEN